MYYSTELNSWGKSACRQEVIADTVTKVNELALSAVFASKYGVSAPVAAGSR
jgi:hypothetical protein